MATLAEIKAKLVEYETAIAARDSAQAQHDADLSALNTAVSAEQASRQAWVDAIRAENAREDELEALIVDHEPPAIPETT